LQHVAETVQASPGVAHDAQEPPVQMLEQQSLARVQAEVSSLQLRHVFVFG
jgi:hypothetical protein